MTETRGESFCQVDETFAVSFGTLRPETVKVGEGFFFVYPHDELPQKFYHAEICQELKIMLRDMLIQEGKGF